MLEFTQHAYSLRTPILILAVLAVFAVSNGGTTDLHSESCTREQSTAHRKSFHFRTFGNASDLEQCVDFCCRDDTCELAIFSRGSHCYGVSCEDPGLCHKILDRLLMEDERQLQRDSKNAGTKDFIRHTSQVANPRCPKRFVPSFHVLLLGTSTPRQFQKLREQSDDGTGQCSAQCCKSRDCLLSFIEDEECYGVTGVKARNDSTKATQEPRIDLQVAIIDRNKEVSRSLDDDDEDPDDLGSDESDLKQKVATQTQSKPKQPELKVKAKLQTSQTSKVSSPKNSPKTKTNGSRVSNKNFVTTVPTKGSSQYPAHLTSKLHRVQPSVQANAIPSKGSHKTKIVSANTTSLSPSKGLSSHVTPPVTKSRTLNPIDAIVKLATTHSSLAAGPYKTKIGRPNTTSLSPSKGLLSHVTPPVTKSRTINPPIDAIVKLATTHSSSTAKPKDRAGPSKAKYATKVKPTAKDWKPGTRQGIQRIHTEGYPKIKHDVKHFEQTTKAAKATVRKPSGAHAKALKTGKDDQRNSYKSSVAKSKSYIPRFTVSVKEGSSQDVEGSASGEGDFSGYNIDIVRKYSDFSGESTDLNKDDKDLGMKHNIFSGEDSNLSGEDSDLSGDNNGLSGDHKGLSGDHINLGRIHNGFSGDNKDLSREGKDSSGIKKDLMEDNEGLSGDDEDLRGDSGDHQKINHHVMQQKTYVGEDKEGLTRTKIDLVKDLDELGSDEDDSDQSNKEHSKLASGKATNLPQKKHVKSAISKTETNNKENGDGQMKSKRVKFHPKQPHGKKTKQAATIFSNAIRRPSPSENKFKKDSTFARRPSQSGAKKHSVISSRPTTAQRLKDSTKNRNGSSRKVDNNHKTNDVSLNSKSTAKKTTHSNKQVEGKKEGKLKIRHDHKRPKTKNAAFTRTKHAKLSSLKHSSGRGIKTKNRNKGTDTSQTHTSGFGKHGQSIKKYKQVTNRPKTKTKENPGTSPLSRKTLKVVSTAHKVKTVPKTMQRAHQKVIALPQKTKSKNVKDQLTSQKQVKSKGKSLKSKSNLENSDGTRTNTKHRKSLKPRKFQEIHSLQSKEKQLKDGHKKPSMLKNDFEDRRKEGKLKLLNSNTTLENSGDLMHYAHRKVSLKHKPSPNRHIEHYVPTKKRAAFDSTTTRQQEITVPKGGDSFKEFKANHNKSIQGKMPSVHPMLNARQKESKSQRGTTASFKHQKTESLDKKKHDKLGGHKSLVTTPKIPSFHGHLLSTATPKVVSSKENSNLTTHPGFTSHPRLKNTERNSSDSVLTSSNNGLLSIKQRSNTNSSDTKANFLAHFHQADSSGSDGVQFSVKSHGKHHRRKGKQNEVIDVDDLGDADFDIMMSNDIPHKDLPKKGKGKQRDHKHAGKDEEKEHATKDDDSEKKKKRKKGISNVKDEHDDTDDSEKSSATRHSSRKHEDKSSKEIKKSTTSRHHHHHHHKENDAADKDEDEHKHAEKESHQRHHKHEKSANAEEDSKSENHHHNTDKTHARHDNEGEKDDDNANRVETKHENHHHNDAKKSRKEESRKDDSEDDNKKEQRHRHKHKKHYDDNHWEGKIIPGKVKVTYEEDSGKKRHHKHHIKDSDDNSEMKKEHHKRKHTLRVHETHSDSDGDEETEIKKHHRHSKEKALHKHHHENEDDDYKKNEEHTEYREDDQEKHHSNDEHIKEKEEHAEKRTDVNYEVVKKDRHRLVHEEDTDDDDNESSKSKHDDKDDDSDEKQNSEEDKSRADDDDDHSESAKHNRVVLGEDSDSDEEDEDKHAEESHERDSSHGRKEHRDNEREDEDDHKSNSHEEDHKSAFHNRHKEERHWKLKHKQYESHEESNEADNDDNDDEKNNFRKSFIYHRKKKKQQRWRQHKEKERDREEEYNNDNHEKEFYAVKHRPYNSYKHRHHHYRPSDENDNKKTENYEDHYEPKKTHEEDSFRHHEGEYERKYEHNEEKMREYQKQHEDSEQSRFREYMKEHRPDVELEEHNIEHFHQEKERHHGGYISHEDDQDRKIEGPPYRHDHQHENEHRVMEGGRPRDDDVDHRAYYKEGPKYEPRHRKKGHWKHRHRFHEKEWHDFEGTGGLFDSSAWMRNDYSDDDYGGEGNQEYNRRKHHKHKHRKHRQSYEYWGYRDQNPYYYDYNYYKSRPRYRYYKPRPAFHPPAEWHKQRYGGYNRWKPKPTNWYQDKEHWDRKSPWRSFQENRPTAGYQWHTIYSDRGFTNQPKPTAYPREPSHALPPTNPRWQQPDETHRGFGGNNWPPGHSRGTEKQYNNWSKNGPSAPLNQHGNNYPPQQNPSPGLPPSRTLSASKPNNQQQQTGVQSKYVPPAKPTPTGVGSQARLRPTVRRQYSTTPPSHAVQVSNHTTVSQIKNIMDKLNTPPLSVGGQQPGNVPNVNQGPVQNTSSKKDGIPKMNLTSSDQMQDRNRLNGFFNEENGGKKKSDIIRPANVSHDGQAARNSSSSANASQHVQQTPPRTTTTPAKLPPQTTQVANKTTTGHTTPIQTTSSHTSKPTLPKQNSSTTVKPTQTTTTEHTPTAPNFGDVSQSDDSSGTETGKKHRKHRAPVCIAGKTTDDVTLLHGKRAGNFTNIGDVGDFELCIKRCCQHQKCDLAFKSAETCFLVNCFSKESCQTSPSIDDVFSPRMCFVRRHSRDDEKESPGQDGDDEWDDKVSPSGIREVCDAEKALGIMWKKTVAGRFSGHPCPRGAKGFVKRRCEADSRWLPPDFSECVSKDYQTLFDKSKKLATGADPSPLIRELSQLTTQNIDNSLIFGGDLNRATDIMAAIVQHNGQTELLDMTREDVENFVRASSNLLDMTNQQEWFNIQRDKPGTADVLRSMEMFALQAAMRLPREDMAEPTITNNIIIKMDRKSPGDGGLTFPDFSNPKISRWDARHDVIALPSSVFDRGEVSTASISFKSLPYLLPDSNVSTGLGPNSKVISTVLHPHPQEKITPPVTVVLSHIKRRRGNPKCVFWDYTLNPHRGGAWSSRGCWLAFSNHSHSICQCSHLSNFAVLMDLSSDEVSQKEQKRERTMALMWIGIPVLIVGVIGGLYMSFSWNRKSGMPSTVTRPSASLNEKTGLLGQRVVTSQVREEFPASPTRDLYRALSPGYSPTGDLEWQDEFDFELESGDQGFKQMLLPKLQMLQKHLINEFYDGDKVETKKIKLLESKIKHKSHVTVESPVQCDAVQPISLQTIQHKPQNTALSPVQPDVVQPVHSQTIQPKPQTTADSPVQSETVRTINRQVTQTKSQNTTERPLKSQTFRIARRQTKTTAGKKLRVRFADESLPGRNLTDEDKERFKRLQRMERRVFVQHLSRWTASSRLNLPD